MEEQQQYGLWDRKHKQWLGNGKKEAGPNVYDNKEVAQIAASLCAKMLELPLTQIIAKAFGPEDKDLLFVGDEEVKHNFSEVISEITKGTQQHG